MTDEFGGVAIEERDAFGGIPVATDEFGGVPVEAKPYDYDALDLRLDQYVKSRVLPFESTTHGGPPARLASFAETAVAPIEQVGEILHSKGIPFPELMVQDIKPDDNPYVAAGKEVVNVGLGIPQFLTSTLGIGAVAAGTVAPKTVAGAFSADMIYQLGKQIRESHKNWDQMTPAQKSTAIVDMTATGAFAALLGGSVVKGVKTAVEEFKGAVAQTTEFPGEAEPNIVQLADEIRPLAPQTAAALGGEQHAETIRSDTGQVRPSGTQPDLLQNQGSKDLEQLAQGQSKPMAEGEAPKEISLIPSWAARYNPDILMQRPAWVEPGSMLDKVLGELRDKNDPFYGKDIAPIWKRLTPTERQDLAKRGWTAKDSRDPNAVVLTIGGDVPAARKYYGMQRTSKSPPKPTETPKQPTEAAPPEEAISAQGQPEPVVERETPPQVAEPTPTEPISVGPGAASPGDVPLATQLRQLAETLPAVKGQGAKEPLRISERVGEAIDTAKTVAKGAFNKAIELWKNEPQVTDFDRALGEWGLQRQESSYDAYKAWQRIKKQIPNPTVRGAIAAFVDSGGDRAFMEQASSSLPSKYASVYKRALEMSPDEVTVANNIRQYFDSRLQDAIDAGILEDGVENYIRRIYEKDSDWKNAVIGELQRLSTGTPNLAKKRFFEYDAEAIAAGHRPIMDFAARVLEYDQSLNHAIADRSFVKSLMSLKMKDERPMIDVAGTGIPIESEGVRETTLIKPQFKPTDVETPKNNRSDYVPFNHPAFRKWKWATNDAEGKPIFVQGDVLVHPDAIGKVQTLLEKSKIRQVPILRGALKVSSTIKQTMLDLSGFHPVQIGIHALEHKTLPIKDIDLTNPVQRNLVRGGLVISGDRGFYDWAEGLHGTSLTRYIPKVGPKLQDFHDWMFKDWIPTVKMNMALNALERNRKRYPEWTDDQLYRRTAEQSNAAFGGLNYKQLGRSQTMQDVLRLLLLAPDFLEARGRFAGQALKGGGKEQLTALGLGAATLYVTARVMNQILNNNPHWEEENLFSIVHNGHSYGLRTVQGDILHLINKPGQFWYHRLNPATVRPLMEAVTGRNYFGQSRDFGDQLLDELKTVVPISLRGLVEGKEETLTESALNAFGIVTKRYTALGQVFKMADEWKKENKIKGEPGEFIYDPEKDELRSLKLSLQFNDTQAAADEIGKLVKSGHDTRKLRDYFRRYAKSPFTGSRANDIKFQDSLNDSQKDIVRMARQEREKMLSKYESAYDLYNQK